MFDSGRWSQRTASNDEVIMLAQNGKIQAYALEKVLGDLEHAVTIRRALICKSSWYAIDTMLIIYSPCYSYSNT